MKYPQRSQRVAYIQSGGDDYPTYQADLPPRILVVDDDQGIRDAFKAFLKSAGYQVYTSPDPFQALEIVKDQFIHLVILDLCMPGMNGIDFQKRLNVVSPESMQIIITGYESLDSALNTLKAGAYDYLTKPVMLPTLQNVVQNCLEKQRLEMDNRRLLMELSMTCEQLKEREEALEAKTDEANYYLQNILEKANDIIFTLDMEGNFTYINPKIESLGYQRDVMIGSSFFSLLSEKAEAVSIYRSIKMGRPRDWEVSVMDNMGSPKSMIVSFSPLHDVYRGLTGALGIGIDITNQKGAGDLFPAQRPGGCLSEQAGSSLVVAGFPHDYCPAILSALPIGIGLYNGGLETLQVNPGLLDLFDISCSPGDVVGRLLSAYLKPSISTQIECAAKRAMAEERPFGPVNLSLENGGYATRELAVRVFPVKTGQGEAKRFLLLVEDFTECRNSEKRFFQEEKVNSIVKLASGVAHEVRNPLSIILGSIQYLRTVTDKDDQTTNEQLDVMAESCGLMESIINELLDFARPRSMIFRLTDINACMKKTVTLLRRICERQKVEVRLALDPALPFIACDEQHIGQVFINLIMNAVQSMEKGGALTIATKNEALHHRLLISFQDTGAGIAPENLERIFDPFFSTKSKGIGLGLAFIKSVVEDHYGRVWVTSRVGEGSRFNIHLPYRSNESKVV